MKFEGAGFMSVKKWVLVGRRFDWNT